MAVKILMFFLERRGSMVPSLSVDGLVILCLTDALGLPRPDPKKPGGLYLVLWDPCS